MLEPTKQAVLGMKKQLDEVRDRQPGRRAAQRGQAVPSTTPRPSPCATSMHAPSQQQLRADFRGLPGRLFAQRPGDPGEVQVPQPDPHAGRGRHPGQPDREVPRPGDQPRPRAACWTRTAACACPGWTTTRMGTIFEELIRRFNEENNEEAGEHFTPRDVVQLMADLIFLPIADAHRVRHLSGLRRGVRHGRHADRGGGDARTSWPQAHGKEVSIHLYGQEVNAGNLRHHQGRPAAQGRGRRGREHSASAPRSRRTRFRRREFDFMLSNPPYGKSWKTDLERMGGKKEMRRPALCRSSTAATRSTA